MGQSNPYPSNQYTNKDAKPQKEQEQPWNNEIIKYVAIFDGTFSRRQSPSDLKTMQT